MNIAEQLAKIITHPANEDLAKEIKKRMDESGYLKAGEFPNYLRHLFIVADESFMYKGDDYIDLVLESLDKYYQRNKLQSIGIFKDLYQYYCSLSFAGKTMLSREQYKKAIIMLGLPVKVGGGNYLKVYMINKIPDILDENDYL